VCASGKRKRVTRSKASTGRCPAADGRTAYTHIQKHCNYKIWAHPVQRQHSEQPEDDPREAHLDPAPQPAAARPGRSQPQSGRPEPGLWLGRSRGQARPGTASEQVSIMRVRGRFTYNIYIYIKRRRHSQLDIRVPHCPGSKPAASGPARLHGRKNIPGSIPSRDMRRNPTAEHD
jgi:hypothetical protein